MAKPLELQKEFSTGIKRDFPRESLPPGGAWNLVNLWPNADAALRKRAGWTRPFTAFGTSGSYATGVGFAPFTAGSQIVGVDNDSKLVAYSNLSGTPTLTARGTACQILAPPIFYRNNLYFPDALGASEPKVYGGTGNATTLGGSPPPGSLGTIFKDHLILAASSALRNRVWFASAGELTGTAADWATGDEGQWIDVSRPIGAITATSNAILVFQEGFTERLRGDIIPGVIGGDYVKEPLWDVGCTDPGSVCHWEGMVVFANSSGVYATDGSTSIMDLTEQGGIKQLWASTVGQASYSLHAAVFNDKYHVSVMNGATFVDQFVCDLTRRTWWRNGNMPASMMVATPIALSDTAPSFYMADRSGLFIDELTNIYSQGAASDSYKNDGNGTAVGFILETPHYKGASGLKRWRYLTTTYALEDSTVTPLAPVIVIGWATDPSARLYHNAFSGGVELPAISNLIGTERVRLPIQADKSEGIQFKYAQTIASKQTTIRTIEAEVQPVEASRRK